MKLSTKLASLLLLATTGMIVIMGISYYFISKDFYQNQLEREVTERLKAHREAFEFDSSDSTLEHIILMEQRNSENSFIIFNEDLSVYSISNSMSSEKLNTYKQWINDMGYTSHGDAGHVETMEQHIPHIWAFEPLTSDGEITGFLFLDQDTGEFDTIKNSLVTLITLMSIAALCFSGAMVIYYTKKITSPLVKLQETTKQIAQGNFDIHFKRKERDELSYLIEDIASMASQLKQYRDTKQSFLSNVSHDLRTPLTYIKAYSAILKETKDSQVKEQSLIIYKEAQRMERLVEGLFHLMKLEENNKSFSYQETILSEFISDVTSKIELPIKENGLTLKIDHYKEQLHVELDVDQMERAFLNLIENAIRHTPSGGTISITVEDMGEEVKVTVADNGEGIRAEELSAIWDRFYRVDKARNSKNGGSGLGLPITRQIIEQHKGSIDVKSRVNEGTTFTIYLKKKI
ncbi:sensor histidine kinase [Alteribacter aurantiacus]|uniref:sensor histidine kinase n=1 Tax=Alteribacter aurantiacus TaxID=254410 RepID=UPI00040089CD|nr:HAMP domain-containing sensor histidine kinase [Alteribacter aurantiacus]